MESNKEEEDNGKFKGDVDDDKRVCVCIVFQARGLVV